MKNDANSTWFKGEIFLDIRSGLIAWQGVAHLFFLFFFPLLSVPLQLHVNEDGGGKHITTDYRKSAENFSPHVQKGALIIIIIIMID